MNVLIVDDEPLAREALRNALADIPKVKAVREACDAMQAMDLLKETPADVIMLDIQMPQMDGFAFLERVQNGSGKLPIVVFVTAFDEFAVKAFDRHAADYVLKPFEKRRVAAALDRAELRWQGERASSMLEQLPALLQLLKEQEESRRIAVESNGRVVFLDPASIHFALAEGNYFVLHLANGGAHMLRGLMGEIEEKLKPFGFIRIHRSYIVNTQLITRIDPYEKDSHLVLLTTGARLPASKAGYLKLKSVLGI